MVEEVLMNKVSRQYSNTDIISGDIVGNNSNIIFYFQHISILDFFFCFSVSGHQILVSLMHVPLFQD